MAKKKLNKAQLRPIYQEAQRSQRCICGKSKARREAFCTKCLRALPWITKAGVLGNDIDAGASDYAECVKWLEDANYLGEGAHAGTFGGQA